jgi:ribonuclease R
MALASSIAERRAMEVERAVVDLYRAFLMRGRIGGRFEGTVTAVVGSGIFVQLDSPFVDVLVRIEDLGPDHWEVDDEALRAVAARSGGVIGLGDRILVEVIDVSILRRTVYAKRVVSEPMRLPPRKGNRRDAKGVTADKGKRLPKEHTRKPKTRGARKERSSKKKAKR